MTPEALTETVPNFRWFRCSNCERCTVTMLCGCSAPAPVEMFTQESHAALVARLRAAETALQQIAEACESEDMAEEEAVVFASQVARAYLEGQQ